VPLNLTDHLPSGHPGRLPEGWHKGLRAFDALPSWLVYAALTVTVAALLGWR
jgi:hypothetical protein